MECAKSRAISCLEQVPNAYAVDINQQYESQKDLDSETALNGDYVTMTASTSRRLR